MKPNRSVFHDDTRQCTDLFASALCGPRYTAKGMVWNEVHDHVKQELAMKQKEAVKNYDQAREGASRYQVPNEYFAGLDLTKAKEVGAPESGAR